MIDPKFVTVYNRSDDELEEFALFSVCVAGKNAHNTAKSIDNLLNELGRYYPDLTSPFEKILQFVFDTGLKGLQGLFKEVGIGNHTGTDKIPGRAKVCYDLACKVHTNPSFLLTCTPQDLEEIKGIGAKTSRFFILHTRPNVRIAALDTHILKFLRDSGIPAPKTTPSKGSKLYAKLEEAFLDICDKAGKGYAEYDLEIWNKYSLDGLNNSVRMDKTKGVKNGKSKVKPKPRPASSSTTPRVR